jgi:hypothetical protein
VYNACHGLHHTHKLDREFPIAKYVYLEFCACGWILTTSSAKIHYDVEVVTDGAQCDPVYYTFNGDDKHRYTNETLVNIQVSDLRRIVLWFKIDGVQGPVGHEYLMTELSEPTGLVRYDKESFDSLLYYTWKSSNQLYLKGLGDDQRTPTVTN